MSKLREKFKTQVSINTSGESERFAKQCEQITDDFSVKLLIWINSKESEQYYILANKEKTETEKMKYLEQIFKEKYYE